MASSSPGILKKADSTASSSPSFAPSSSIVTCIALTLLACICSSYESTLVHGPGILDSSWIVACVIVVAFIICIPIAITSCDSWSGLSPYNYAALAAHAAFELFAMSFIYLAITRTPVGNAVALFNLSAVWTPILECMLVRKRPSLRVAFSVAAMMFGAILIIRPPIFFGITEEIQFPHLELGYMFAFLGSISMSCGMVLVSYYDETHWTLWLCALVPVGTLISPIFLWTKNRFTLPIVASMSSGLLYSVGFVVGLLNVLSQILVVLAVQADNAATSAIANTLEIPVSYIFGLIIDGEHAHLTSLFGAFFIVVSILLLVSDPRSCECCCGISCGGRDSGCSSSSNSRKSSRRDSGVEAAGQPCKMCRFEVWLTLTAYRLQRCCKSCGEDDEDEDDVKKKLLANDSIPSTAQSHASTAAESFATAVDDEEVEEETSLNENWKECLEKEG